MMGSSLTCTQASEAPTYRSSNRLTACEKSCDLDRDKKSRITRLKYVLFFLIWTVMTFVLLSSGVREALQSIPHLCTEILGNNLCMEMTSFDGIYRMFFISALYHLILAVLLFDYGCNQKTQDSLQNHFWITKTFLFVLLAVGAFFISKEKQLRHVCGIFCSRGGVSIPNIPVFPFRRSRGDILLIFGLISQTTRREHRNLHTVLCFVSSHVYH